MPPTLRRFSLHCGSRAVAAPARTGKVPPASPHPIWGRRLQASHTRSPPPRACHAPTCGGDLGAPWRRLIPCRLHTGPEQRARRSARSGAGSAGSRAQPTAREGGAAAASSERPPGRALRQCARRGCRRGGAARRDAPGCAGGRGSAERLGTDF